METASYVLFVLGCLGAADIALFHSVAHGIRSHPDSVSELITHSLRGPTYAALFLFVPNFAMQGLFAWGLAALLVFDVGISICDFSLEQSSRRFLGGLPTGEYVLHMLMAMVFGMFVATLFCFGSHPFNAPTRLVYAPAAVPAGLRLILLIMAILVLVSGIQDAAAAWRLRRLKPRMANIPQTPIRLIEHHRGTLTEELEAKERLGTAERKVPKIARGMRLVLVAAGIYNLLWGTWVVLFPGAIFRWAGIPQTNYPQIWQCVGMIVGVYGIGYLIAARDPFRNWPIILVGLIGKVLGPCGMWWSVAHRSLPPNMGWTCLANDLIWWIPFAVILRHVFINRPSSFR